MKIYVSSFKDNKPVMMSDEIDFSHLDLTKCHVHKIDFCLVEASITNYEESHFLKIDLKIKAKVHTTCAYSLEDVKIDLNYKDNLIFSDEIKDDNDIIFYDSNIINLDEYVLDSILSEVPLKIVKKGKKLPQSGEGYRVLSEDEYLKEQENKPDSRWSILDNIEFDD